MPVRYERSHNNAGGYDMDVCKYCGKELSLSESSSGTCGDCVYGSIVKIARWGNGDKCVISESGLHQSIRSIHNILGILSNHLTVNISTFLNSPYQEWKNFSMMQILRYEMPWSSYLLRNMYTKVYRRVVVDKKDMSNLFYYVFASDGNYDNSHKFNLE